jgi:hypothetical protein
VCQAFLLGTAPRDQNGTPFVSGSTIYVVGNTPSQARDLWSLDANSPSNLNAISGAPTALSVSDTGFCILGNTLFWNAYTTPASIGSCSLPSCSATTVTVVSNIPERISYGPVCDAGSNELVWVTTDSTGATYTVRRASTQGANSRPVSSFAFTGSWTDWGIANTTNLFSNGRPDRLFYSHQDTTAVQSTLYYISTSTPNASGVAISTIHGYLDLSSPLSVLANATAAIFSANDGTTSTVYTTPLPNGTLSGAPPAFSDGALWAGVLDANSFYGLLNNSSVAPNDAVIRCPTSKCTAPAVIGRGQAGALNFTQDEKALYWVSAAAAANGFTVWKAAK